MTYRPDDPCSHRCMHNRRHHSSSSSSSRSNSGSNGSNGSIGSNGRRRRLSVVCTRLSTSTSTGTGTGTTVDGQNPALPIIRNIP